MILLWVRPISIAASIGAHVLGSLLMLVSLPSSSTVDDMQESDAVNVDFIVSGDDETSPMQEDTQPDSIADRAEDKGHFSGTPTPRQASYSPPPPAPARERVDGLSDTDDTIVAALPAEPLESIDDEADYVPIPKLRQPQIKTTPAKAQPRPAPTPKLLKPRESAASTNPTDQSDDQVFEPKQEKVKYDLKNFAALLNIIPDVVASGSDQAIGKERKRPPPSEESNAHGFDSSLSRAEQDVFESQVSSCWNWNLPFTSVLGEEDLSVTLRVELTRHGEVRRNPLWINEHDGPIFRLAAESASRAILNCAPYKLPADKYEGWSVVEMTFDPEEMLQ